MIQQRTSLPDGEKLALVLPEEDSDAAAGAGAAAAGADGQVQVVTHATRQTSP